MYQLLHILFFVYFSTSLENNHFDKMTPKIQNRDPDACKTQLGHKKKRKK